MGIKLEQEILTLQEEEEVNWNYIEKNNKETYPENNQDVLVWDEYYGYNVCAYYEGIFEDKHGNTYKNVLGWVPVPEPIERKRAF